MSGRQFKTGPARSTRGEAGDEARLARGEDERVVELETRFVALRDFAQFFEVALVENESCIEEKKNAKRTGEADKL